MSDVSPLSTQRQREPFFSCMEEMVVSSKDTDNHELNLFQKIFIKEKDLNYFVLESLGCVIVNSGVTATKASRVALNTT